jgi:UDP-glucuronate 4-epimerase
MKKNEYILITGVAGFIGSSTAQLFLQNNHLIIGVDNENDYYSPELKKQRINIIQKIHPASFKYIKGDISEKSVWKKLEDYKISTIINLAAQAGVRYSIENPWAYINSNIIAFQHLMDFVKIKKIKKIFYASSSSVYGKSELFPLKENFNVNNPESIYAATKISNELFAAVNFKISGIISIGLRFFTVYGPWGRPDMAPYLFIDSIFNDKKIKVFNEGEQYRDFTYIDDITNSIYELYKKQNIFYKNEIINIGSGNPIYLKEFVQIIEKITNKKFKKELVEAQKGDVVKTYADVTKLKEIINFEPKTNINQGISKTINWYKQYKNI